MPYSPPEAVAAGSARDLDLMIGWCHDETRALIPESDAKNPAFVPRASAVDSLKIQRLMVAYSKADPQLTQAERVWKAAAAEIFVMPSLRIADAQAAAGGKIHTYRLDYAVLGGPFSDKTPHGTDIPMIFEQMSSPVAGFFGFSAADAPMAKTMHAVWSSFIHTGTVEAKIPSWPSYDLQTRQTMILDRTPCIARDIAKFEREVWDVT
jgi:para-nitrobenzyl esterase